MMATDNLPDSLMFRCPKTGKEFDSGFKDNPNELRSIPLDHKTAVKCKSCFEAHEFKISESWIAGDSH